MEDIIKKQLGETDFEYGLRLIENKVEKNVDLDWQDIVEILNLDCHRDSLRKSCNVGKYNAVTVSKYYKDKIEELVKDNSNSNAQKLLNELRQEKIEIQKEKYKLQDEKREIRNFIRTEARWEELKEIIVNEVQKLKDLPAYDKNYLENCKQMACLLLSDIHFGIEVENNINKYNTDIAKMRLSKLKDKTIKYCRQHNVKQLNLEILGDLVSGIIHTTTRLYQQEDIISQVMQISEILANFICELSNEIEIINIYYAVGNHSRVSPAYKESLNEENFEYLIKWYLKERLKNMYNVKFKDNEFDDEICVFDVFDKTIASSHGHFDRPNDAINKVSKMLNVHIDQFHLAHYHNFCIKDNVITNGTIMGLDQYAKSKRFKNEISQTLIIYYENGDECYYKINLK